MPSKEKKLNEKDGVERRKKLKKKEPRSKDSDSSRYSHV
jgi:hypothetical protein